MIKVHFILLFCFSLFGFSQEANDSISIQVDSTSVIEQKSFGGDLTQKYNGNEFDYSSTEGEAQNLMSRFLNWLSNFFSDNFGFNIDPSLLKALEIIIYIALGILVIYLLVRFFIGENFSSVFSKKATSLIDINLSEEHIENIDLDAKIKEALQQKNYRLAVRYHYLSTLKNLSAHNIISWEYEKTNSDYQEEISRQELKPLFQEVSYLYDYIWYGEQDIDEIAFNMAQNSFKELKNSIAK